MKKLIFTGLAIATLTACSSTPKVTEFEPTAEPEKAVIYHYRQSAFVGGGRHFHITNNEVPVAVIENGSMLREVTDTGELTYHQRSVIGGVAFAANILPSLVLNSMEGYEERIRLNAEPNQIYFIEWKHGGANLVEEEIASPQIIGLKIIQAEEE